MTAALIGLIVVVLVVSLTMMVWASVLSDESNKTRSKICYNCPMGWCDVLPGEKGCIHCHSKVETKD